MKVNSPDPTNIALLASCIRLSLSHLNINELQYRLEEKHYIETPWAEHYINKTIELDPTVGYIKRNTIGRYIVFNEYAVQILLMDLL